MPTLRPSAALAQRHRFNEKVLTRCERCATQSKNGAASSVTNSTAEVEKLEAPFGRNRTNCTFMVWLFFIFLMFLSKVGVWPIHEGGLYTSTYDSSVMTSWLAAIWGNWMRYAERDMFTNIDNLKIAPQCSKLVIVLQALSQHWCRGHLSVILSIWGWAMTCFPGFRYFYSRTTVTASQWFMLGCVSLLSALRRLLLAIVS